MEKSFLLKIWTLCFSFLASIGFAQNQWIRQSPIPTKRSELDAAVISGRSLNSAPLHSTNPAGGTWTVTGSLNPPRAGHSATLLANGMVLAAGGGASLASTELYDPASGSWAATGSLNTSAQRPHRDFSRERGTVRSSHWKLDSHRQAQQRTRDAHGNVAAQLHGAGRRGT